MILFAVPDEEERRNRFEVGIPSGASLNLKHDPAGVVPGLDDFVGAHPPVAPVFYAFRVMVGVGALMIATGWAAAWFLFRRGDLPRPPRRPPWRRPRPPADDLGGPTTVLPSILPPDGLPVAFAALMALSVLAYVVLDGYDLGIGVLLPGAGGEAERDRMVASIGPFWDANETWLVLGVGLLLVAFPAAHGAVLTALYLPVAAMLVGLTLRGVAFEFRAKAAGAAGKRRWDRAFSGGSLLAALAQGWMLGRYVLGFAEGWGAQFFAALAAAGLAAGYAFIGACWLIWRTEGALQRRAVRWARAGLWAVAAGIAAVSVATPLASERIFHRWFDVPNSVLLAPLPLATFALLAGLAALLRHMPLPGDALHRVPFWGAVGLFCLSFAGLAWSFYPYVVPERLTLWQAASAPESLAIILAGAAFVLPVILAYTVLAWRVFGGKARDLRYY